MIARRDAPCADSGHGSGFTLLELLLAMALAALLILGLVQIVSATSTAGSLQSNQAQILDHARFAIAVLSEAVRQAGYRPEPWNGAYGPEALTPQTANGVTANGDRLAVRSWSDLNCFDNRNPELDSDGHPRFYLRESVFDLSRDYGLTRLCRYGPDAADLTTQIRRQGMVPGVESFQVLFGEDGDLDGNIERWVTAGQWGDPRRVLGIRIGLLFASEQSVVEPLTQEYEVLDAATMATGDGKLRQVFDFTVAIRGRTP
jgi:prepilin-type N-terminal cleavage/methylation domain-containing protein